MAKTLEWLKPWITDSECINAISDCKVDANNQMKQENQFRSQRGEEKYGWELAPWIGNLTPRVRNSVSERWIENLKMHLTHVGIAKIKKTNNRCFWEFKGEPHALLLESTSGATSVKSSLLASKHLEKDVLCKSTISPGQVSTPYLLLL